MKNYKLLVPILLVIMFVGSIYMLYDTKLSDIQAYNETLETARDYRLQDIQVDAEEKYMEALEMDPSIELSVEIGEFYRETGQIKKATKWGEEVTEIYPQAVQGYEFLMGMYDQREDYIACYDLAEIMQKRGLRSDSVDKILERMEYFFYFNGKFDDVSVFGGGMCPVKLDDKWGYVDMTGDLEVDVRYVYAGPFSQDMAPVTDGEGKAFFIDPKGNKKHVVLNVENVKQVGLIENEIFSLFNGTSWGFYNKDHEHVFGEYEAASSIGNGIAAVMKGGQWMLVDRTGKDLTGKTYPQVVMDEKRVVYRNERLFVSDGAKLQMITSAGKKVGDLTFEDAHLFVDTTYAAVKMDGKWGFIDKDGKIQIPAQYEAARSFSNGLAAVKQNGLWGFIDLKGEMVIAPQFDDSKDFNSNGCVFILNGDEWKLLRLYKTNH